MNKLFNFRLVFIAIAMLCTIQVSAQSRDFIRKQIDKWGECRNVAITQTNGDLALYGKNGYAHSGCPEDLNQAIVSLNEANLYIDDVQLTEEGRWLILVDNNEAVFNGIPESLKNRLNKYYEADEVVNSVTFNDDGDWIVITQNYVTTSDPDLTNEITKGCEKMGKVWAACLTNDAMVIVYENGYKMSGNVPSTLEDALDNVEFNVFRLKIAGECWFMADVDGNCSYDM